MTAVEYIEKNFSTNKTLGELKTIIAQAKELEKQQVINFAEEFSMQHTYKGTVEQYYNKKYKK